MIFLEVEEGLGGITAATVGEVKGVEGGGDGEGGVEGDSEEGGFRGRGEITRWAVEDDLVDGVVVGGDEDLVCI